MKANSPLPTDTGLRESSSCWWTLWRRTSDFRSIPPGECGPPAGSSTTVSSSSRSGKNAARSWGLLLGWCNVRNRLPSSFRPIMPWPPSVLHRGSTSWIQGPRTVPDSLRAMPMAYPLWAKLDHNMMSLPVASLWRNGPSVTYTGPSLAAPDACSKARDHGASEAVNSTTGSPSDVRRSGLRRWATIPPSLTCFHSWQKTIQGTPSSSR
ncbi:hypothetical protein PJL18_01827 [Paenarthrobacter nicotinovorans]|nr:hypothetical protein [Paenarthrobacter nicotinovorans]